MSDTTNLYQVIIIGSGFGGQCAALKLKKMGIDDFLILERRSFAGGTWCQNTYPGAAVDVQSALYSIESEPYNWSQMFAEQDELQAYTNYVLEKNQLPEKIRLNTQVKSIVWNEQEHYWQIATENGEMFQAQFVINASGPLSNPFIPEFRGREKFNGVWFHTNNWNHEFNYNNKRVAIIGSGASAAQIIPAIVDDVEQLHIFQRTPHWVLPRPDYVFKTWQRGLLKHKFIYNVLRKIIYWGLESRVIAFKYSDFLLNLFAQKKALKFIKKQIPNQKTRKQITPDYTIGCKRIILSNTLYPAYCRDNVSLHSKEDSIEEITETGIKTTLGENIDLDLIIYSTGYDAANGTISYPVIGNNKIALSDVWKEFPRAYLGTTIPGFPNLFLVTGPNTGIGHTSAIFVIEAQMEYIGKAIHIVNNRQKNSIEVNNEAEEKYTKRIHQEMKKTVWYKGGCDSWYQSKSGHVIAMFPGFSFTFKRWAKNFKISDHKLT